MSCIRNSRLPFLPGFTFNDTLGKQHHRKNQHLKLKHDVRTETSYDYPLFPSIYSRKMAPELPSWIVHDKQILTFDAYYQCTNNESRQSPQLIRPVKIHFFLEDGTIRVVETRYRNSGMTQGTLIGRQRIRLPVQSESFFDVLDLNVGFRVEFFGKIFKVLDCDNFTRVYLNRLGIRVPDRLPLPNVETDLYKGYERRVAPKTFPFSQFLEFDRKVLRFYGYWDDRVNDGGRLHHVVILYYLGDDTMQVNDMVEKQCGIELPTTLIKKTKMPKKLPPKIEMSDASTHEIYKPEDLAIGAHVWAFHREIVITDCDDFTKEYYRTKYGIDDFTPLTLPKEKYSMEVERVLPPWNGYGSYEDTAQNCRRIDGKPPKTDIAGFLKKDRIGMDSHVLRYAARLISEIPENSRRLFVIKFYLANDTLSIFELAERNSGFLGGRFASRQTMYMPNVDLYVSEPPPKYLSHDMWVGNILVLNGLKFHVFTADEYAIRYMELHSEEFPKSNVGLIMDKIRRTLARNTNGYKDFVAKYMNAVVPEKKHLMPLQCFKQAIKEIMCDYMTEQEFITIARFFRGDYDEQVPNRWHDIQSLVMTQIVRELWNDRDTEALELMLKRCDEKNQGTLPRAAMRQALRACRLPLDDQLMECMLNVLQKSADCSIRIADLMLFLNFKLCRNVTDMEPECIRHSLPSKPRTCYDWIEEDILLPCGYVNWNAFICQLKLEHLLKEQSN